MGRLRLRRSEIADLLADLEGAARHAWRAGTFNRMQLAPWLTDGTADWFWPAAEKAGLAGDVAWPPGRRRATSSASPSGNPDLVFIIDHMACRSTPRRQGKIAGGDRRDGRARQVSECACKVSSSPTYSSAGLSVRRHEAASQAGVRGVRPAPLLLGHRHHAHRPLRQVHLPAAHHALHRELDFLSEQDKDWVMGRAIEQRLGWA